MIEINRNPTQRDLTSFGLMLVAFVALLGLVAVYWWGLSAETARRLRPILLGHLDRLAAIPVDDLLERRYARYRAMGPYAEIPGAGPEVVERPGLAGRLQGLIEAGRRTLGEIGPPRTPRREDAEPTTKADR